MNVTYAGDAKRLSRGRDLNSAVEPDESRPYVCRMVFRRLRRSAGNVGDDGFGDRNVLCPMDRQYVCGFRQFLKQRCGSDGNVMLKIRRGRRLGGVLLRVRRIRNRLRERSRVQNELYVLDHDELTRIGCRNGNRSIGQLFPEYAKRFVRMIDSRERRGKHFGNVRPNVERKRLGARFLLDERRRELRIRMQRELFLERKFVRTNLVRFHVRHNGPDGELQSKKPGDRGRMEPNAPLERERHDQSGSGGLLILPVDARVYGRSPSRLKQRGHYE